jgi:hypothetical protein
LNQGLDAVHTGLIETMQTKIVDYSSFVKFRESLPIYGGSVKYEAEQAVNVIPFAVVKQEGIHSDISQAENDMPNIPIISGAPMPVCPKIEVSPAKKQRNHSESKGQRTRRTSLQR